MIRIFLLWFDEIMGVCRLWLHLLFKVRVAEYNNVRGQLNAINRKQSGR